MTQQPRVAPGPPAAPLADGGGIDERAASAGGDANDDERGGADDDTTARMIKRAARGRMDRVPSGCANRGFLHQSPQTGQLENETRPPVAKSLRHCDRRAAGDGVGREEREREGDDEAGAGERAMVYSRFLELPSLGSAPHGLLHRTAALSNPLDPVTASLEAKWLGVSELVLNATAEAKRAGVTTPHPYAENSICFVEPMVSRRVAR